MLTIWLLLRGMLTGDGIGMLLLFISFFWHLKRFNQKTDPEPWRHIFNIIYYGFGDAKDMDITHVQIKSNKYFYQE